MRLYIATLLFSVCMLFGQATGQKADGFDVACKNLKIVPSKPHVGDRLWVRFEVVNLSAKDIPGKCIEVNFSFDGKVVIGSGGYPTSLKAKGKTEHSVAEQYMEPLKTPGPHEYRLVVTLKKGAVDVDTTNNVIAGVLTVLE